MTTLLYVKAHPLTGAESKTLEISEHFIEKYKAQNPNDTVEVLDLFDSYIPEVDYTLLTAMYALRGETEFSDLSSEQQKAMTRFNELTEQFLAADKIVIANALWNLNVPTKLKAWFDTVNVAGKTFKYTETGAVPLTSGKKVLHIQSSGGHYAGNDFATQYIKGILNFVGVEDHATILIEGIDHSPETKDEVMSTIRSQAEELATSF